jgi:hypothetical protein
MILKLHLHHRSCLVFRRRNGLRIKNILAALQKPSVKAVPRAMDAALAVLQSDDLLFVISVGLDTMPTKADELTPSRHKTGRAQETLKGGVKCELPARP